MTECIIKIDKVSKEFVSKRSGDKVSALNEIDLDIWKGEFVAIVGPSGCGKSTLLSCVAGFLKPSSGRILFKNSPVTKPDPARGVLFQDYALFPWRTVIENVEFGPLARGVPKDERLSMARYMVKLVGLEGFEKRFPHELSGGMRQRCALARLLANEPLVWLMDEPLAALDMQTRLILQEELLRLWGQDTTANERPTVIFITHGIEEAVFLADRVVVLGRRPGRIKEIVEVDIPRPRTRTMPAIGETVDYVWDLIREEAAMAIYDEV